MKAFLLAGGLGTRLKPITNTLPKCLVPVAKKPLLEIWLETLFEQLNVEEVCINTHYFANKVETYVAQSPYRSQIKLVYEAQLKGTLGTLRDNREFFDGDEFLVAHADNFCVTDWQAFINRFRQRPDFCELTMMLFKTANPASCGMVDYDENHILRSYVEKPQGEWLDDKANGAVFLMDQNAIHNLVSMPENATDLCKDYIPGCINKANVYFNQDIHIDIGTPHTLKLAQELALDRASLQATMNKEIANV